MTKIETCVRVGCDDGRIWNTLHCLRHTGDTEAIDAVIADAVIADDFSGGRTSELHGVTSRLGILRALHPGERPAPGDLLPDGRVLDDGALEPYPEDVIARVDATIADLDAGHPDSAQVAADMRAAVLDTFMPPTRPGGRVEPEATPQADATTEHTPMYLLCCSVCGPNGQQMIDRNRNELMPPHTWDWGYSWCSGGGKPGRLIADVAKPPPVFTAIQPAEPGWLKRAMARIFR
jgi:hypothetical protein